LPDRASVESGRHLIAENSAHSSRTPWPIAVSFLIRPLGETFTLAQVYALADPLRLAFPDNKHVEAKIRQSLQILRDRGRIQFEGAGRYRKLVQEVRKSVRLDFSEAADYASRSQIARVAVEAWAATNVVCWRCTAPLLLLPANAFAKAAPDRVTAAAFGPIAQRLETAALPDYLLVSYDAPRAVVLIAEYVDGTEIQRERVYARKPLAEAARRAGWVGATIDLSGLTRQVIVGPSFAPEVTEWS
jgi:hypothetical protein